MEERVCVEVRMEAEVRSCAKGLCGGVCGPAWKGKCAGVDVEANDTLVCLRGLGTSVR